MMADPTDTSEARLNGGAIAGIVIAVLITFILLILFIAYIYHHKSIDLCSFWMRLCRKSNTTGHRDRDGGEEGHPEIDPFFLNEKTARSDQDEHEDLLPDEGGSSSREKDSGVPDVTASTTAGIPTKDASSRDEMIHSYEERTLPSIQKDYFDDMLKGVAKKLVKTDEIEDFGSALGFEPEVIQRYIATNFRDQNISFCGTLQMLRDWRKTQTHSTEYSALKVALIESGSIRLADQLFGGAYSGSETFLQEDHKRPSPQEVNAGMADISPIARPFETHDTEVTFTARREVALVNLCGSNKAHTLVKCLEEVLGSGIIVSVGEESLGDAVNHFKAILLDAGKFPDYPTAKVMAKVEAVYKMTSNGTVGMLLESGKKKAGLSIFCRHYGALAIPYVYKEGSFHFDAGTIEDLNHLLREDCHHDVSPFRFL